MDTCISDASVEVASEILSDMGSKGRARGRCSLFLKETRISTKASKRNYVEQGNDRCLALVASSLFAKMVWRHSIIELLFHVVIPLKLPGYAT